MGGVWVHRIVSSEDTGQGICSHCGPVRLIRKAGRWKCSIAKELQRGAETYIKHPHGLTSLEAAEFKKGKSCAICNSETNLVVDHCHTTGVIRGVLCSNCNFGLGQFKDNPELLKAAIQYLA